MRYSPETLTPWGWRTAASNSCETAFSMTSRDWRRTRLGARRKLASTPAMVPVSDRGDATHEVVQLALDVNQQRVVAGPGVGTGHQEQIRISVHARAFVSLRATVPFGAQQTPPESGHREWRTGQVHVVAGGEHDAVQVMFDAVAGPNAHGAQGRYLPMDQLAVVALQGGIVVAGDQHAFASRCEVGGELAAQPRVFDLSVQVQPA